MITVKLNTGDVFEATSISEVFDLETNKPRISISVDENFLNIEDYAALLLKDGALNKIEATLENGDTVVFNDYSTLFTLDKAINNNGIRVRAILYK